jgi:phage protein D|nr:MAG TPA: tail protein [Caudoviricetes sp.]
MNSKVRNTAVSVLYHNSNTNKKYKLDKFIKSLSYTDIATGEGDTISVELFDDGRFLSDHYPGRQDRLECKIRTKNLNKSSSQNYINCGSFNVDKFGASGTVNTFSIEGISTPKNSEFAKSLRSKNWKKTTLKNIAQQICKRYKIRLYYHAKTIKIKSAEQSSSTDCSYLYSLCQEYGLAMKIYSNRLIIFEESTYEAKKSVAIIRPNKIIDESFNADIELIMQYTGYKFSIETKKKVKSSSSKRTKTTTSTTKYWHKFIAKPEIMNDIGQCDSVEEGHIKGAASVNEANKNMTVVTFTIPGNTRIIATSCIRLYGFGALDDKYYVNKVTHNYDADSGYTMEIEARRIQQRLSALKRW